MSDIDVFTLFYLACFQACAWPQVIRIIRRGTAGDLSLWREALIVAGCLGQIYVMVHTGADWHVFVGPFGTLVSLGILTGVVLKYRGKQWDQLH